jgi:hypothetical protein
MGIPEEDRVQFPVSVAGQLADELDKLAGLLDRANQARADAGNRVPDYQGAFADAYHRRLGTHLTASGDTVTRYRSVAAQLRAAIDQHHRDRAAENRRFSATG